MDQGAGGMEWSSIRMSRAEFSLPVFLLLRRPFNPLGSAVVINIKEVEGG